MKYHGWLLGGGLAWLAAIAFGWLHLWDYTYATDTWCPAPEVWPAGSSLRLDREAPTLVMFIHPHCPCTRASLAELARLVRLAPSRLVVQVCVFAPRSQPNGWEQTNLWGSAEQIPGIVVLSDPDAAEARRFGAAASGTAVLYDTRGRLRFAGGITTARGHEGDSIGKTRILAILGGQAVSEEQAPVFGCAIVPQAKLNTCCADDARKKDP